MGMQDVINEVLEICIVTVYNLAGTILATLHSSIVTKQFHIKEETCFRIHPTDEHSIKSEAI